MFQKFMNKKDFHPGSKWNIKRVWMAEQKQTAEQQRETDMAEQYKKEQEKFENRQMVSKDEKLKLGLSFIYDVPPGFKDEKKDKDEGTSESKEEEVKFEWLKGAPKEAYAKDLNLETRSQPFGIPVRNVRCIRCHKWGHINTDRECPLRNTTVSTEPSQLADSSVSDPLKLMQDMRNDGLALKQSVLGRVLNKNDPNQQYLASDDEQNDDVDNEDPELAFLATLNEKQKRKLLRKLNKLEKNGESSNKKRKNSSSDSEEEKHETKKSKHKKTKKRRDRKSDSLNNERSDRVRHSEYEKKSRKEYSTSRNNTQREKEKYQRKHARTYITDVL